jgi:hypothetical protein
MQVISEAGKMALDYSKRFRSLPTLTIAKMLVKDFPDLFSCAEKARNTIRYYRGKSGALHFSQITPEYYEPRVLVPESDNEGEDYSFFEIDAFPHDDGMYTVANRRIIHGRAV